MISPQLPTALPVPCLRPLYVNARNTYQKVAMFSIITVYFTLNYALVDLFYIYWILFICYFIRQKTDMTIWMEVDENGW